MTDMRYCPRCGTPIPSGAPSGLCPKCLLAAGLESDFPASGIAATQASPAAGTGFVPPEPEELASLFPHLEILELLGKGGMGAVYKARQPELDRIVAVKILPPEISRDPAFAERFTREARALAKLSHPNIVGVYDFGQTGKGMAELAGASRLFYIVMEYVDGVNLRQAIQAGSMSTKEALAIVPQICEALQFAHDEGVVHRDIKPENILIDKRGRVKIADFGLAKMIAEGTGDDVAAARQLTGTHQVIGTLRYMAPEQIEGTRSVDHRADIYSLGVVFYELLTGELPLGRFAPPSKKVQIDVRLDEVVLRALEKEPELRWQQASELRTQVETIVGGEAIPQRSIAASAFGREYRSERTVFGLPLVHIAFGIDPRTGRKRHAKGIIAIGDSATGVVAIGGAAYGALCFGGFAAGLISFGGLSLGLFALGGFAAGLCAWGGCALGVVALGGFAVGYFAYGGYGLGSAVLAGNLKNEAGQRFFEPWAHNWINWMTWLSVGLPAFYGLVFAWAHWMMRSAERRTVQGSRLDAANQPPRFSRTAIVGAVWAPLVLGAMLLTMTVTYQEARADGTIVSPPQSAPAYVLVLAAIVVVLGLTAPFATTILGMVSIGQIRRSEGKLYGLPLAVGDALLFPLLLLDGIMIIAVAFLIDEFGVSQNARWAALVVSLPIVALADYFIARAAWRAAIGTKQAADDARVSVIPTEGKHAATASATGTLVDPRRIAGTVLLVCSTIQIASAIVMALFLLGAFDDPAEYDGFFNDTEARMILLAAQGLAFLFGMWSLVGGLALKTTGEMRIARAGNKSLLVPLTPSWIITCVPTIWAAGLLRD